MRPLLCVRNLSFAYGQRNVFRNVNLNLFPGDAVALLGPNGTGKTTLLKICAGLLQPQSGEVVYLDKHLGSYKRRELARHIALVPQEIQITFDFTVRQFVQQGRTPHLSSLLGALQEHDQKAVCEAMERAQVSHLAERNFNELSGGERQRVKIALAIAQAPKLLLLDEPTQHLDIGRQAEIFSVIRQLNESGISVMAAVHDLRSALAQFRTGVLITRDSQLICGSITEVLAPELIRRVFGLPGTGAMLDECPRNLVMYQT